jgi:hypothetical protein
MSFRKGLVAISMLIGSNAMAVEPTEAGFESFDLSLDGVDVNSVPQAADLETIFVKQDKDFPDQVSSMIASEKEAWEEHAKKLDKGWWNQGIDYCRSYRYGFRHSFYNGYRYSTRNNHGYSYSYNRYSHRNAYEYGYRYSYRNYWSVSVSVSVNYSTMTLGYRSGYQNAYRNGHAWGRRNHGRRH